MNPVQRLPIFPEVDQDGHPLPFGDPLFTIIITERPPEGPVHPAPVPLP